MGRVMNWIDCLSRILVTFVAADITAAGVDAPIIFKDITKAAGLREPLVGLLGHGGAWGDFDNDGRIDLFVGGFCDRPNADLGPAMRPVRNKLLRNLGDGRFASVQAATFKTPARTSGAIFADLDNNGTLDLYVANNAKRPRPRDNKPQKKAQAQHCQFFRNDAGTFVDISTASGACPATLFTARNIGVLDYDADGLLDLFIVEDSFTRSPRSVLLRNLGDLKFKDVTNEVGLPEDIFGLGLAVGDVNGDRRPDLFVGHSNRMFLSQPGSRYREAVELADTFKHEPFDNEDWPCGVAFGDFNRDGRLDLVISAHANRARNRVFLNQGLSSSVTLFREVTREAGLDEIVPVKCTHVEIQDFDNDGWLDIYFSAAWLDDSRVTPLIYRHAGFHTGKGGSPGGVPRFEPLRPIREPMVYYPAGPCGDFDNDGRLDLFLVNWFSGNHSRLLRNVSPAGHWLQVEVVGRRMNRMGIGAQVRIFRAGKLGEPSALLGFQETGTGYGYASGQPGMCCFGLGVVATVDIEISLPDGSRIDRKDIRANQRLVLEEP